MDNTVQFEEEPEGQLADDARLRVFRKTPPGTFVNCGLRPFRFISVRLTSTESERGDRELFEWYRASII